MSLTLTVIIVNYNAGDYLKKAIESVKNFCSVDHEIIVVDNASTDDSLEKTEGAKIIRLENNIGFGPANNVGIKHSRGKYILFLNPDAELLPGAIEGMMETLKEDKVGAVSCLLIYGNGEFQPSFGLFDKGIIGEFFDKFLAHTLLRLYVKQKKKPFPVKWISGAVLMTKKEVLEKAGVFDPDFFLYMEDVDLCKRMRKAGYTLMVNPRCKCIHHLGKSSDRGRAFIEAKKSQLYYYRKWKGPLQNWLIRNYLRFRLGRNFQKIIK